MVAVAPPMWDKRPKLDEVKTGGANAAAELEIRRKMESQRLTEPPPDGGLERGCPSSSPPDCFGMPNIIGPGSAVGAAAAGTATVQTPEKCWHELFEGQ